MISRTRQWLEERRSAFSRTPFGCLVGLFLNRLFRGAADAEAGELDLGVAVILVLLVMPGLLVSLLTLEKYGSLMRFLHGQGAFDPFSATISDEYLFIVLSASVTAAAALWRWDAIFLDRRDYTNLVPLPLSLRTLFSANLCAILSFAAILTIVANGASMVLFPIAVVGSQPSLSLFLRFAAGHAAAVLSASVFSFFFIFALAGLLTALLPSAAFRKLSLSIRFVSVIALLALLATSFTVPDLLKRLSVTSAHGIAILPPISFLGIARTVWGNANDPFSAAMTGAALIAIGLAALTAMVAYIFSFRRSFLRLPELADAGPIRRLSRCFSPLTFFHNLAPRSSSPRACCQFVARSLLRSTAHLQTLLCSLAVGLVVSAESLSSASLHFSVESNTSPPMEFLSIPFILSYCLLAGIRFAFEIPLDLRANWIFRLWLDPDGPGSTTLPASTTHFQYDRSGNLTVETDPLEQSTFHAFDALNREVQTIQPVAELARICREKEAGLEASLGVIAKSHSPLRLSQSLRTICGRGYSGRALSGVTSFAQRVISGPAAGFHASSAASANGVSSVTIVRIVSGRIVVIV